MKDEPLGILKLFYDGNFSERKPVKTIDEAIKEIRSILIHPNFNPTKIEVEFIYLDNEKFGLPEWEHKR